MTTTTRIAMIVVVMMMMIETNGGGGIATIWECNNLYVSMGQIVQIVEYETHIQGDPQ